MDMRYSLIIPHYNLPHLLDRLLATVPERDDLQIIVVDDCSSQEVLSELDKLKRKYPNIEFYSTETNGGGGKARNIGLDHAKGKYIIFADADDFFNQCFNEILDKYKNTDYDTGYFKGNSVDTITYENSDRDRPISQIVTKFLRTNNIADLKYKFTAPWCKFISSKMIKGNGIRFHESKVYNDMHFSLKTDYYSSNVAVDPYAIYCVTKRENSVSSVTSLDKENQKLEVVASYLKEAKRLGIETLPIWLLIGPILCVFNKKGFSEIKPKVMNEMREVGISRINLYKTYYKYKFMSRIVTPSIITYKYLRQLF